MTYTTQELIDECTKWIGEANTPDMAEFVTALRDKLLSAQDMADSLMGPNYTYHAVSEMYGLDKKGRERQEKALAKWKDS